jgi:SAM-dependent methyltransferase
MRTTAVSSGSQTSTVAETNDGVSRLRYLLTAFPRRAFSFLNRGETHLERTAKEMRTMRGELAGLRKDIDSIREQNAQTVERLRLFSSVVTRAARALEAGSATAASDVTLSSRSIPVAVASDQAMETEWAGLGDDVPPPDPEGREWLVVDRCPVCDGEHFTVVSPWNKFILLERAPDAASTRYDYAVCHTCGILFASRRPCGTRYRFLLEHFGEVTAKRGKGGRITNRALNPEPLTDEARGELRRLAAHGAFVSDHLGLRKSEYLAPLLRDRFENSTHIDVIASLLSPRDWRVLEIRSRTGTILEGLRRAWGARVFAMPIWESQQFLLREVYGIETSDIIDFDEFTIPFDGPFDLIVCNHMFTHVLRPRAFFAELRTKLRPGGYVYFHNEPDDAEYLAGGQSMLATLNPLHLQAFDQASFRRALAANGFDVVFQKHAQNETQFCVAQLAAPALEPMTESQRTARVEAYRRALDRAVLRVDKQVRARFADEWPQVVERAVASGVAEFDEQGQLRLVAR